MLRLISLFLVAIFFFNRIAYAAPSTPSAATPSSKTSSDSASDILNQITDKVSQLGSSLKRAYSGEIRTLGTDTLSLTAEEAEVFVETNEATKFFRLKGGKRSDIEFKNLKVGEELTVIGTFDESTKTLTARQIVVKTQKIVLFGRITEVNKNLVTLFPSGDSSKLVDLSPPATIKKITAKNELVAAKTSEISVKDYLGVVGFYEEDKKELTALRVVLLSRSLLEEPPEATSSARGRY